MRAYLYRLDNRLTKYIKEWPAWLSPVMNKITLLGDPVLLIFVIVAAIAAFKQDAAGVGWALVAVVIASVVNGAIKQILQRKRPDTLYVSLMRFKTYSFPSGHAFGASVIYGLAAYLSVSFLGSPWEILAVIAWFALIVLVGISRVYLGAHYPSDVIAGWLLGLLSLVLIIKSTLL